MEKFLTLASRIRYELLELDNIIERIHRAWELFKKEENSFYIDSIALNLHHFYSGIERIFELIAEEIDGAKPKSSKWHKELLKQMSLEIPNIRPKVISFELEEILDEYRAFRHIVRSVYTYQLSVEKIRNLLEKLDYAFKMLKEELEAFCVFLESNKFDI